MTITSCTKHCLEVLFANSTFDVFVCLIVQCVLIDRNGTTKKKMPMSFHCIPRRVVYAKKHQTLKFCSKIKKGHPKKSNVSKCQSIYLHESFAFCFIDDFHILYKIDQSWMLGHLVSQTKTLTAKVDSR